ncbi:tautomerase family protein [Actinomyces ruminicola]|uniref:tautomerase family protein n=1 Tax=Actinomyces ruminicola TaxID=332524 RepID=UPI000B80BF67
MPIVRVTTWDGQDEQQVRELMIALTDAVLRVTGAPRDKITVLVEEIPRACWAEGGSVGTDPDFAVASRQH